jgi:deoxycytidylate deaminase
MMNNAFKEATKSECRCKHGAIIVRGGSILAKGYNKYRTHPTWGTGPLLTVHAEAAAIRSAERQGISIHGAIMYIARNNMYSQMSRPCAGCEARIRKAGIRKIIYTDKEGYIHIESWKN